VLHYTYIVIHTTLRITVFCFFCFYIYIYVATVSLFTTTPIFLSLS